MLKFPDPELGIDEYLKKAQRCIREKYPELEYVLGLGSVAWDDGMIGSRNLYQDFFNFSENMVVYKSTGKNIHIPFLNKGDEWQKAWEEFDEAVECIFKEVEIIEAFEAKVRLQHASVQLNMKELTICYHHEAGFFLLERGYTWDMRDQLNRIHKDFETI